MIKKIAVTGLNIGLKAFSFLNVLSKIKTIVINSTVIIIFYFIGYVLSAITHENDLYRQCEEQGIAKMLQSSKVIECKVVR